MPHSNNNNRNPKSNNSSKSRRRGRVRSRTEIGLGAVLFEWLDLEAKSYDANRSHPDMPTCYQCVFNFLPDPSKPKRYLCNLLDRHKWRIYVTVGHDFPSILLEEFNSRTFASNEEFGAYMMDKYHLPNWSLDSLWVPESLQHRLHGKKRKDAPSGIECDKENAENQNHQQALSGEETFLHPA